MTLAEIISSVGGAAAALFAVFKLFEWVISNTNAAKKRAEEKQREEELRKKEEFSKMAQPYIEEFREALDELKEFSNTQDQLILDKMSLNTDTDIMMLRQMMLDIYYRHLYTDKHLHKYELQLFLKLYELYHVKFNQNSFITKVYDEIMTWK